MCAVRLLSSGLKLMDAASSCFGCFFCRHPHFHKLLLTLVDLLLYVILHKIIKKL